jgi:hypothetical protein
METKSDIENDRPVSGNNDFPKKKNIKNKKVNGMRMISVK